MMVIEMSEMYHLMTDSHGARWREGGEQEREKAKEPKAEAIGIPFD